MSTHNICFHGEITKNNWIFLLSGAYLELCLEGNWMMMTLMFIIPFNIIVTPVSFRPFVFPCTFHPS